MLPPSRILIVEDEETLAENLRTFLGRRTPDVRIAPDAETAMEMLKSFTPDLLVLDYALPGIDGLRVHRDIVRVSPRQPGCVMITGYPTELMAEGARQQGIHHLLSKPFSFAELQHAVDASSEDAAGNATSDPAAAFPAQGIPAGRNRRAEDRRVQQIHWMREDRRCLAGRRLFEPVPTPLA